MAIAVLAEYSNEDPDQSTFGTSIAVTGVVVPAGATVQVWVCIGGNSTITVSDSVNPGTYTSGTEGQVFDPLTGQAIQQFHFQNSAAGTLTITASLSGTEAQKGIWAAVITGARPASFDQSTGQVQNGFPAPITSGFTGTLSAQPALVIALSSCFVSSQNPATPGAGFTSTKTAWTGPGLVAVSEYMRVTSTAAVQGLYGDAASQLYATVVSVFLEAATTVVPAIAWVTA